MPALSTIAFRVMPLYAAKAKISLTSICMVSPFDQTDVGAKKSQCKCIFSLALPKSGCNVAGLETKGV
jgi:hypothetical protein